MTDSNVHHVEYAEDDFSAWSGEYAILKKNFRTPKYGDTILKSVGLYVVTFVSDSLDDDVHVWVTKSAKQIQHKDLVSLKRECCNGGETVYICDNGELKKVSLLNVIIGFRELSKQIQEIGQRNSISEG